TGGIRRGATAITSGSGSASSDAWQRRQLLLVVRYCTSWQVILKHRTTSRESTGARVVDIGLWECQSGLLYNRRNCTPARVLQLPIATSESPQNGPTH